MMWIDQLVSTKLVQRLRQSRVQRGSWLNVAKAIYSRVALKGVRQVTLDGVALLRVPDQRIAGNLSREREDVASRFSLATFSISSFDGPTISILMPVYRPPIRFLERAILSV
ncbi:hypothetical protein EN883_36010, partial [Mesorhizobium sp. M7A.F.Ca.AU.002.06.1.1]